MACVRVANAVGVLVSDHVAELPLPVSVQLELLKVPAPLLLKLTVPVGVLLVPTSVSVRSEERRVERAKISVVAVSLKKKLVERLLAVTRLVPELPALVVAPL